MKVSVSHKKIKGGFGGIALRMKNDRKNVAVGVLKGAGSYPSGGPSIASVAHWNSEGTDRIPSRPFIKQTLAKKKQLYIRMLAIITRLTLQGSVGAGRARRNLGIRGELDVKQTIKSLKTPRNADSTIARKGFDDPLIHTKKLLNVISWQEEDV